MSLADRIREVEHGLPTSCTVESQQLVEIADELDAIRGHRHADLLMDTELFYAKHFPDLPFALTPERLRWRFGFLEEELTEVHDAIQLQDAASVVDGLIDLMVIALGTLHEAGVNISVAWRAVHEANMQKTRGSQAAKRPGSSGFDLVKPAGWVAPDHSDNVGTLREALR